MSHEKDRPRPAAHADTPTALQLKAAIDSGRTGDKVAFADPGAAPLGTDDEAAGTPDTPFRVATAMRQELEHGLAASSAGVPSADGGWSATATMRPRPRSPNIQIYRPQLTSVLSIINRLTGVALSVCAVALVVWLVAGATGPQAYNVVQGALASWPGQMVLVVVTFAFFLHFCGGIRHLVWDTVHGFKLRTIYISGWAVVMASVALTVAAWVLSSLLKG